MLAEIYLEALLADLVAADAVWSEWQEGSIDTPTAALMWLLIAQDWRQRTSNPLPINTT
jgi:hypothetical protein